MDRRRKQCGTRTAEESGLPFSYQFSSESQKGVRLKLKRWESAQHAKNVD